MKWQSLNEMPLSCLSLSLFDSLFDGCNNDFNLNEL